MNSETEAKPIFVEKPAEGYCATPDFVDYKERIKEFEAKLARRFAEAELAIKERNFLAILVKQFLMYHDSDVWPHTSEEQAIADLRTALRIIRTNGDAALGEGETPTGKGVER